MVRRDLRSAHRPLLRRGRRSRGGHPPVLRGGRRHRSRHRLHRRLPDRNGRARVASTNEPLRHATAEVFESWLAALDNHLVEAGLTRPQARNLSVSLFSLLEGAFILARATRDDTHVRTAGRTASDVVRAAFDKRAAQQRATRRRH